MDNLTKKLLIILGILLLVAISAIMVLKTSSQKQIPTNPPYNPDTPVNPTPTPTPTPRSINISTDFSRDWDHVITWDDIHNKYCVWQKKDFADYVCKGNAYDTAKFDIISWGTNTGKVIIGSTMKNETDYISDLFDEIGVVNIWGYIKNNYTTGLFRYDTNKKTLIFENGIYPNGEFNNTGNLRFVDVFGKDYTQETALNKYTGCNDYYDKFNNIYIDFNLEIDKKIDKSGLMTFYRITSGDGIPACQTINPKQGTRPYNPLNIAVTYNRTNNYYNVWVLDNDADKLKSDLCSGQILSNTNKTFLPNSTLSDLLNYIKQYIQCYCYLNIWSYSSKNKKCGIFHIEDYSVFSDVNIPYKYFFIGVDGTMDNYSFNDIQNSTLTFDTLFGKNMAEDVLEDNINLLKGC